ncbi:MAG: ATP-binding cassette domain-containing protein [Bacteroidia bacterium]|nr:ATP-binding cassette domain-containing protein [Bacteroidia bacterium]
MTAIEFENISKQYRLGLVSTRTLSHDLKRWYAMNIQGKDDPYLKIGEVNDRAHRGESEYVWALKDINFKVEQGDVLGIIGKNGAGKSTLLKILSKVTTPSTGTIKARGRIASLLEVGTGFHPEMTGRENIYMNGAIMGMTKAEISRKFDEIVDFSGVERYIDTPAKRYSSGMTVRLGFAIAAHLEPEILVVDEVLAVGDAEFQKKAIGKMQDVSKGEGRTVLFVSHNMASIQKLCKTGLLLKNGCMDKIGNIEDVISEYNYLNVDVDKVKLSFVQNKKSIKPYFAKLNVNSGADIEITTNGIINIEIFTENIKYQMNMVITIVLRNEDGIRIIHTTDEFGEFAKTNDYRLCKIPAKLLSPGKYYLTVAVGSRLGELYEKLEDVLYFSVYDNSKHKDRNLSLKGILSPEVVLWEN